MRRRRASLTTWQWEKRCLTESPAKDALHKLQRKQGVGLRGDLSGWEDPPGSNLRLRSPSVLVQLQTSLMKKETKKTGIDEGREEK